MIGRLRPLEKAGGPAVTDRCSVIKDLVLVPSGWLLLLAHTVWRKCVVGVGHRMPSLSFLGPTKKG